MKLVLWEHIQVMEQHLVLHALQVHTVPLQVLLPSSAPMECGQLPTPFTALLALTVTSAVLEKSPPPLLEKPAQLDLFVILMT